MSNSRFHAWITKDALTTGIAEVEVEDCFDTAPTMVHVVGQSNVYYHGKDWHRTRESAVRQTLAMIVSARRSLDKKRAKLDALERSLRP